MRKQCALKLNTIGVRARGAGRGGCSHPRLGQNHYFSGKSYIFRQKPAAKTWKKHFFCIN